jgi:membrane protein implicated in regulation of membrane protease activity
MREKREENQTMRKTKKNTLAAGALVALLLLTGCETRIDNPHAVSTAALTGRKAELQEKERNDAYGIYVGPTRWISHALDEKKSRDELRSIDAELALR